MVLTNLILILIITIVVVVVVGMTFHLLVLLVCLFNRDNTGKLTMEATLVGLLNSGRNYSAATLHTAVDIYCNHMLYIYIKTSPLHPHGGDVSSSSWVLRESTFL